MKACIVSYSHYELDYRVRRYAEALVERGNSVDVIALRRKGQEKKFTLNGVTVYGIQKRNYNERGLIDYIVRTLFFFLKGSLLLTVKSLRSKYQIVHVHNVPDFLIFMGTIPKVLGSKLILDIHDILPEFFCQKFGETMDRPLAKFLLLIEKISIRFAHHVIVANDLWREKIISRNELSHDKCTTLLNYPNTQFFQDVKPKQSQGDLTLIYPGTLSHLHGIDILINAMFILKKDVPKINLKIYTRANNLDYFNSIQSLIDKVGVRQNVQFHEAVPIEELAKIYSQAHIGVVCKREGIFASEAFSTKIFDFMAAGLPIVASKTKIDEYYFNDSMIMFFEPGNHEDLAKSILKLYLNSEKQKSMIESGKAFVQKNTWEIKKLIYLKIVKNLVRKNK